MKLKEVHVRNFRNILDSTVVNIQPDITCIVGKNESGKTAFLHALYRLNPARENVIFSVHDHYPAWLEKKDRQRGINLEDFAPISVLFEFDHSDIDAIESKFGKKSIRESTLQLNKNYKGVYISSYTDLLDENASVKHFLASLQIKDKFKDSLKGLKTFMQIKQHAKELATKKDEDGESANMAEQIQKAITALLGEKNFSSAVWDIINTLLPKFFYFDVYSKLPYSVNINKLLTSDRKKLNDAQLTALSLLKLAGAEKEYLLNPDYEKRKRELENVASALTDDVLKYWSQNKELRVQPDITQKTETDAQGQHSILDELKIRIWDQRHYLSLPFGEHSTGFQWFFSFLAAFSEYEYTKSPIVILLDEPALGLHARAQADFLRFIDERLAPRCQVIYSTHSPFMIQPGKLDRVRLVEDKGREHGSVISQDVLTTDRDTIFPLQGALGYDLVQNLFIAPNNVIVEGTSDYTYMRVISDFLKSQKKVFLDDKCSLLPVGGIDLIPTFVALLGHHLNVTVIIDSRKGGHQKLNKLSEQGILSQNRIISIGSILGLASADIEDLFTPEEYLDIFNKAFTTSINMNDLKGSGPIVERLARFLGPDRFDHGVPADLFLRERDRILPILSTLTLNHFENLFEKVNATLTQ